MCVHVIGVAGEEEENKAEPFLPSFFLCLSITAYVGREGVAGEEEEKKAKFFLPSFFLCLSIICLRSTRGDEETEPGASAGTLNENPPNHQTEEALANIMPRAPVTVEEDHFSSSSVSSGEEEEFPGFLLPEFNSLALKGSESSLKIMPHAPLTGDFEVKDVKAMEEEIRNLRGLVQSLMERERCLERKLLEYHGLKEQEVSMGELQNRLKISATETKLLSLKVESFKAENEELHANASNYSRVAAQLEMQRKNITLLESKLKSIGELAKEKIAALHTRITELREKEKKNFEDAVEVEKKLKMLNELENEAVELRKENSRLAQEKLALLRVLEFKHMLSPSVIRSPDSVLKSPEMGTLEEQNHLREENDKLKRKMEQLQTDRCADVEELVYLRWVNACLRYELRNYQPPPGRTIARDLSKCLSPKSEQKAKQLILEYSNSGFNLDHASLMDFDLGECSLHASSEESDATSLGSSKAKSSKSSKSKILGKLKKLVLGKGIIADKMSRTPGKERNSERRASVCGCTFEEIARRKSHGSSSYDLFRSSLDIENLRRLNLEEVKCRVIERCKSDLIHGAAYDHKRMVSVDLSDSPCSSLVENEESNVPEKVQLKKLAQVFSGYKGSLKSKRRPASLSLA